MIRNFNNSPCIYHLKNQIFTIEISITNMNPCGLRDGVTAHKVNGCALNVR